VDFWKDKADRYFDEIVLAILFIVTVGLTVHLIHKSDAGGNDTAFIVWAETQAVVILTRLISMLGSTREPKREKEKSDGG